MDQMNYRLAMGWIPDYPDFRDFTEEKDEVPERLKVLGETATVKAMLGKVGIMRKTKIRLPRTVDLREWCSPIEHQGALGSCTAHAGVGLVEYFERKATNKHIDASRLFLYKATRNLLHWTGDRGAYLRSTMGALVLFGVPPEEYWPYAVSDFDKEPAAFCYAFAQNYKTISYYRLDPPQISPIDLLNKVKTSLAANLPSMFGFTVYSSIVQADTTGKIPFPTRLEAILGGHAVDAVGFDDDMKIKNTNPGGRETTGALLIRNSWGANWGEGGYGWLPYDYVLKSLAVDWWSIIKMDWVNTGIFKIQPI